jgi:hypothetical protein
MIETVPLSQSIDISPGIPTSEIISIRTVIGTAVSDDDLGIFTNIITSNNSIKGAFNEVTTSIQALIDSGTGLTANELSQLGNIGESITISNTQWGYLGSMNQSLTTTSSPIFTAVNGLTSAQFGLLDSISDDISSDQWGFLGSLKIAIGSATGKTGQSDRCVAVGASGYDTQGIEAVGLGASAGRVRQGAYAIAIGSNAGHTDQGAGSIVINASNGILNNTVADSCVIKPIRQVDGTKALVYNTVTFEVSYATSGTKTFVIQHPKKTNNYLVHACLEGPEAGVYYRGTDEIIKNSCNVELPDYTADWTYWTISLTSIGKKPALLSYEMSDNGFTVYGSGKFSWVAYAKRLDINIEPLKNNVKVSGDGPYKYIKK